MVQAPQPTHRFGVTCTLPRPSFHCDVIATAEQTRTQASQPTWPLRPCAQIDALYWKNLGFSNSPTSWSSASDAVS